MSRVAETREVETRVLAVRLQPQNVCDKGKISMRGKKSMASYLPERLAGSSTCDERQVLP